MIWLSGCIDCEEGGSLSLSKVVGPGDVDSEVDDVIYLDIMHLVVVMGMSKIN